MKTKSKDGKFFVYRFLNENQETLYVGKTKNLTGRIRSTHFTNSGHLPDECYNETAIVVYSQCLSESDMTIQERYLINTLNPKYNDKLNRSDAFGFTINCFDWIYLPFIRPEERPKEKKIKSGLLTSCLPNSIVETKPLAVPSLADVGTLRASRDNPGDLYDLYSFSPGSESLRGLRMNDQIWLSALSICEFSFVSSAMDNSSKIRVIQFIKKELITCNDVCIIKDGAFCRNDYRSSFWGKHIQKHPELENGSESSNGILIRAQALMGFFNGLFERYTRDKKRCLDKGVAVKASYLSPTGNFPTKRCKTFDEYCEFMAGPNMTNKNLFTVAYRISAVCDALSCI